jgi:hypothetical protein
MWSVFHGWRRKFGCVTLAMASIVMVLWVRSFLADDRIEMWRGRTLDAYVSVSGTIRWAHYRPQPFGYDGRYETKVASIPINGSRSHDDFWMQWNTIWRWRWGDFDFGTGRSITDPQVDVERWAIPHWSLAVPMAILSACLLLWKPRPNSGKNA